ncbi:MAG: hypothetical protein IJ504_07940 [Bacteroidales bacterium]|nr:hypothetical protein [Bacteroidales bacterium]
MKKILLAVCALAAAITVSAQSDRYEQRYDLLVSQLGYAGVGVETVLNNWEKADSTNAKMLLGRFHYWFEKSRTAQVEPRPSRKYLGMDPMLTLKDSTGNDVHYFQIYVYDDAMYGEAMKAADKAISIWPDRLDFRFVKANAYIAYEMESPDMALAYLLSLVDENARRASPWVYDSEEAGKEFFEEAMQEYCYSLYALGTPAAYEAFLALSTRLSQAFPSNYGFINNIGSYYMVAKEDCKTACRYYNKVLKAEPDNYIAIRNGILASRKTRNVKQEKKYLEMMVKYGPEKDRLQAQSRLKGLGGR